MKRVWKAADDGFVYRSEEENIDNALDETVPLMKTIGCKFVVILSTTKLAAEK